MFKRTIENFTCEQCGTHVVGNGYTNHCPQCLWSKHVDIHPGDRQATCGGAMEPVSVVVEKGVQILTHACTLCGHARRQHVADSDARDAVVAVAQKAASS